LLRDETTRKPDADEARRGRRDEQQEYREGGLADQDPTPVEIPAHHPFEDAVEATEEPSERAAHLALGPQEQCRERGAQRERVEGRDDDRDGDGDRELLVHPPGDARDERRRHEDGGQDQADRDDRARARKPWRKMNTTMTTRMSASTSVFTISWMPAVTARVVSNAVT